MYSLSQGRDKETDGQVESEERQGDQQERRYSGYSAFSGLVYLNRRGFLLLCYGGKLRSGTGFYSVLSEIVV